MLERRAMKKRWTKVVIIALSLFALSILVVKFRIVNKDTIPKHRIQRWLKNIQWDQERQLYSGKNIKIAVIDTGVDTDVDELENKITKTVSVATEDSKEDDNEHGTAISTIIAGNPKNDKGVLGVAPGASIVSIDVTNNSDGTVALDNLIKGINLAIEEKVDIINISIGISETSKELENTINNAFKKGIIVVAACGNYMDGDILYPAKYPNVISVGSINKKGDIQSPKNYTESSVIYLPGENVVTAIGKQRYSGAYGTSFSTAICTGIIALVLEKRSDISGEDVVAYFNGKSQFDNVNVKQVLDDF